MRVWFISLLAVLTLSVFGDSPSNPPPIDTSKPVIMPGYPNGPVVSPSSESPSSNAYPDVSVSGFIEARLSGRSYSDDITKLDTIRKDAYYQKIPQDVLKGSPTIENRYNMLAQGQLDADTRVDFEIIKEPDFPLISNVHIVHKTSDLYLGDVNSHYLSGDYINVTKYLNGVEVQTIQKKWQGKATLGKEKSEPQKFESFGNNSKTYKLGKSFLLEGSVRVFLNNRSTALVENVDYTVNYYSGSITFTRILTKVDYIKIYYEFTNPIQDFIPSLSRKNVVGSTFTYNPGGSIARDEWVTTTANQTIPITDITMAQTNRIALKHPAIVLGSETIRLNNQLLKRDVDYFLNHTTGIIRFISTPLQQNDTVSVDYAHYTLIPDTMVFFGNNTPGPFPLNHPYIDETTLTVSMDNHRAREFIDFIYKKNINAIEFLYPVPANKSIQLAYTYKAYSTIHNDFEESPFSMSVTYLNESTILRDNLSNFKEGNTPLRIDGPNNNRIVLAHNPIDTEKPLTLTIDGVIQDPRSFTVNYYRGLITMTDLTGLDTKTITIDYAYVDRLSTEHVVNGLGLQTYTQNTLKFPNTPIPYGGITQITLFNPNELRLEEGRDYTVTYFDNGQAFTDLRIDFIIGGFSILNRYPSSTDIIKISHQYTPTIGDITTDSSHSMLDVRMKKAITDTWAVSTEIANTQYHFSKSSEYAQETFTAQPSDAIYRLKNAPVENNSEMVFINGFSQTRDTDYTINYEQGTIVFINKTIANGQKVAVSYHYFLNNTPNSNNVNAYVILSELSPLPTVTISNKYNYVDPNFIPIGNPNITKGTVLATHRIAWQPNPEESASVTYQSERIVDPTYHTIYTKNHYLSQFNINVFGAKTTHDIQFDDITSTKNYKENPKKLLTYSNAIRYDIDDDTVSVESSLSQINEQLSPDIQLNSALASTKIAYLNRYTLGKWIQKAHIRPYWGASVDQNNTKTADMYQKKAIESIGFESTMTILNEGTQAVTRFDKQTHTTQFLGQDPLTDTYYNYASTAFLSPYPWINASIGVNHDETINPIPGQEGRVEDRQGYTITQLNNHAGLTFLKLPMAIVQPFMGSTSSASYTRTNRRDNNATTVYEENRIVSQLNQFTPLNGLVFSKVGIEQFTSHTRDSMEKNDQRYYEADSTFRAIQSQATYKPPYRVMNRFAFDGSITYNASDLLSQTQLTSGSTQTKTQVLLNQHSMGMTITPPSISLWLTTLTNPLLRIEKKSKTSIDASLITSTDVSNNQTIVNNADLNAMIYKLQSTVWGRIQLTTNHEQNKNYYNRNKLRTALGSLYRESQMVNHAIDWSLFRIKNTEFVQFDALIQYKNDAINRGPTTLIRDYTNRLQIDAQLAKHRSEWPISRLISLTGDIEGQAFTQTATSKTSAATIQYFQQLTGASGIIVRPFSGFEFTYTRRFKSLVSPSRSRVRGDQDMYKVTYNPITYKNVQIQLSLSQETNWGFGFNTLQNDQLLQTSDESYAIAVVERDDRVYLGSLITTITLPITTYKYVDSVTLTGEGYIKNIIDHVNPANAIMINGFVFNLRLNL